VKPFWVGFQLTLGVIAACIAIPLVLFLIGLAQAHPQVWIAMRTAMIAPLVGIGFWALYLELRTMWGPGSSRKGTNS